jgi:hypothetical protein
MFLIVLSRALAFEDFWPCLTDDNVERFTRQPNTSRMTSGRLAATASSDCAA